MFQETVNVMENIAPNAAPTIIKVVIIEDLRDIREGLATMLNFTEGFRCVGKFGSMEETLRNIQPRRAGHRSLRHRLARNGRHRR